MGAIEGKFSHLTINRLELSSWGASCEMIYRSAARDEWPTGDLRWGTYFLILRTLK